MLDAMYLRFASLLFRVRRKLRHFGARPGTVYVNDRVAEYRDIWRGGAKAENLEFVELGGSFWEVRKNGRRTARINNYIVSLDDPVTLDLAGDKVRTFECMTRAALPIPAYAAVTRKDIGTLRTFLDSNSGPFVIKPARGTSSGLGVSTRLTTWRECLGALALATNYCDQAIIEEHVAGECYRLLYLGGEMVAAARRAGVRVRGDGTRNIAGLVDSAVESGVLPRVGLRDPDIQLTLERQRLSRSSVPRADEEILVRSSKPALTARQELRTVYDEDVTASISSELVQEGARAAQAIGSEFCGVDVITTDPTVSLEESGGIIDEINTTPGLHHHFGLQGTGAGTQVDGHLAGRVLRYAGRSCHGSQDRV